MSDFLYPLDTTGSALSNRVRGEFQTLSPPTQSDNFHFIIPKSGPYYRDTMKIRHVSTNRLLVRGVDWEAGHYFHSASHETESVKGGIYQSILFLDRSLSGQVEFEEYFILGGEWSLDENKLLEILSNKLVDPRAVTYELVTGVPEVFPPIAHMHPAGDLVGMREQVEATYQIADAIRERTSTLPPEFAILLENYYTRGQVDVITADLATELLTGVAGPELERILQHVATEMLENYHSKGLVDLKFDEVYEKFLEYYTKVEVDDLISDFVTSGQMATAISVFVKQSEYDDKIAEIESKLIPFERIDDIEQEISVLEENLNFRIGSVQDDIEVLETSLGNFLTREDIDYLEKSTIEDLTLQFVATYEGDVDEDIYIENGMLFDPDDEFQGNRVMFFISDINKDSNGKITSFSINIVENGFFAILPESHPYIGREQFELMEEKIDVVVEDFALLDDDGNIIDLPDMFSISATVSLLEDENGEVSQHDYVIKYRIMEHFKDLPDTLFVDETDQIKISIGLVSIDGEPKVDRFYNTLDSVRKVTYEKIISRDDALNLDEIVVDLDHTNGQKEYTSIKGISLRDSDNNLLPYSGYDQSNIPRISNTLTVFKNKIDTSGVSGDGNLKLTVKIQYINVNR